jgi:ABC-type uncharacterized transport system auxiliary subunit
MSPFLKLSAVFAACALVACSLPQPRPGEMAVHTLTLELPRHDGPATSEQLLVELPAAGAPINSDRIAVRASASEYGVLRGQRWAEPAPRLWQSVLVRALIDDGRRPAERARDGLSADERLLGELRAFEYEREAGRVRIHYVAQRVDRGGRVRDSRSFEAEAEVGGSEGADVAQAFHSAATRLLTPLLDWLARPLPEPGSDAR